MSKRFEGWYFKHQKDGATLALIPGRSRDQAFIQVVTDDRAYNVAYPLSAYSKVKGILNIAGNVFTPHGISLQIDSPQISLFGTLCYTALTPISVDIMGPFRYFPMECRHSIVSMNHRLSGTVCLNGDARVFDGGRGYIEGDSGRSFPSRYCWVQCNAFSRRQGSIMASVARIPFAGLRFWGCICAAVFDGREYLLTTYEGARIAGLQADRLELRQGSLRMIIEAEGGKAHSLPAPVKGSMSRHIREAPSCKARFSLMDGSETLFEEESAYASYEYMIGDT